MLEGVRRLVGLWLLCQMATVTMALEIQLDYSLDTNNFFKAEGSPQRAAMRAVADYFEELITDPLAEINPADHGNGAGWVIWLMETDGLSLEVIDDLVVPKDTIIVYVRGESLDPTTLGVGGHGVFAGPEGGNEAWKAVVKSRGQTNADGTPASANVLLGETGTDFGPWGGTISFNTNAQWNYSLTRRVPDGRLGIDFVTVALHEFCHVLGVGTSASWRNAIDDPDSATPKFTGTHSVAEFGRPIPMEPTALDHFQDPLFCRAGVNFNPNNPRNILSKTVGHFGVPGNRDQIVLMNPTNCAGTGVLFQVMTTLDLAALRDVGWTLKGDVIPTIPRPALTVTPKNELFSDDVVLEWDSRVGQRYELQWSDQLQNDWTLLDEPIFGDGTSLRVIDKDRQGQRFYRLLVEDF